MMMLDRGDTFEAGLRFLEATYDEGWPATRHDHSGAETEVDCFHTSWVCLCLKSLEEALPERKLQIQRLRQCAAVGLRRFRVSQPRGAFRFWMDRGAADVDDTALALTALIDAGEAELTEHDALVLFSAYRWTPALPLLRASAWANRFPGVFGVWMTNGPVAVDARVNENVATLLERVELTAIPGFRQARSMLDCLGPAARTTEFSPYYCDSIRSNSFGCPADDGGWPPFATCRDLYGFPYWSCRAVTTAIALCSEAGVSKLPLV